MSIAAFEPEDSRPRRVATWPFLKRVARGIGANNLSLLAAGIGFYSVLALFPLLAALVSIYGLIADPIDVERQVAASSLVLPAEMTRILSDQLHGLTEHSNAGLGLSLVFSVMLAIWSARAAASAVMGSLNIVNATPERRSFLMTLFMSLGFTFGAVLFVICALVAIAAVPVITSIVPLPGQVKTLLELARWPILAATLFLGLWVVYHFGPCAKTSRRLPGALFATLFWVVASALFSWYVSNFAGYDKTYGSLGAAVVLLMWFYVGSYVVLVGAEFNAALDDPSVRRGAVMRRIRAARRKAPRVAPQLETRRQDATVSR